MRKLAWGAAVLIVLVAAIVTVAALSLNRIIAANRERLLQEAQAQLGRRIATDRITVSLWGGLGVRLQDVRIADDPRFSSADVVTAESVTARVRILPLLHGRLEVRRVDARSPVVHLIRDAAGHWNYESLAQRPGNNAPAHAAPPAATLGSAAPLPLLIGRANIEDGSVLVTDNQRSPPQRVSLTQIDFTVGDIQAGAAIPFTLDAALQGDSPNIHLHGTAGPLGDATAIPLRLEGRLGPLGEHGLAIDELRLQAKLSPDAVEASELSGRAFAGSYRFAARVGLKANDQLTLQGQFADIAVAEVLQAVMADSPQRITGSGHLDVDLRSTGTSLEALRSSVSGEVKADVHDVVIKDMNLVNEIIGRASGLPKIGTLVSNHLKPKYAKLFADSDTRVDSVRGTFRIAAQRLRTDDFTLNAPEFGARASGWIGFDRNLDLTGTLTMSPRFSSDVVADIKEAKYLLDDRGQLALPFVLRGVIGKAKPEPDTGYLIAKLFDAVAHGGVGQLLKQFLGSGRPSATPAADDARRGLERQLDKLLGH